VTQRVNGTMVPTVVPSLYFGHLSYTPPPGFSGHFPGTNNVPPGYSYRDNLVSARKDALWANASNPESWQPLSGLGHTLKSKHHDPHLMGTSVEFNAISSHEGLMPGYTGHVPHLRSNGYPGHTYKRLTRNVGATARTDCCDIAYMTEQRQAYADAQKELQSQALGETSSDLIALSASEDDYSAPVELSSSEMQHAKGVWLEFHSKMEEHYKLPSMAFRKIDDEHKGYITDTNIKRMMNLLGIRLSALHLRAIIKGLGCDALGRVTVMDYRRASELSLLDALETFSTLRPGLMIPQSESVRRGGGGGGEPYQQAKRLRMVRSQRSAPIRSVEVETLGDNTSFSSLSGTGDSSIMSSPKHKLPCLVFNPRRDPLIEYAILKTRNKAEGGRHRGQEGSQTLRPTASQMLDGGKRFGIKSMVGYKGYQPIIV